MDVVIRGVTMIRTRRNIQETSVSQSQLRGPTLTKPSPSWSDLNQPGNRGALQQCLSEGDEIGVGRDRLAQGTNRGDITNADSEIRGNAYSRLTSLAEEVLLAGKWKIQILCAMRAGPVRLGQLARLIPSASRKMLTRNLRSLEGYGVVIRRDLSDIVLHVEYDLDPILRDSICSLLDGLANWGEHYLRRSIQGSSGEECFSQSDSDS